MRQYLGNILIESVSGVILNILLRIINEMHIVFMRMNKCIQIPGEP